MGSWGAYANIEGKAIRSRIFRAWNKRLFSRKKEKEKEGYKYYSFGLPKQVVIQLDDLINNAYEDNRIEAVITKLIEDNYKSVQQIKVETKRQKEQQSVQRMWDDEKTMTKLRSERHKKIKAFKNQYKSNVKNYSTNIKNYFKGRDTDTKII
ncbi:hypothetical protein A9264_13095 [Vibrio sp. UCD-FRSSP16_10]|uniref:hypothetical protein n=1 Tax=unclassified Vibrio TaxID=2614977 RepID=UPI0007FC0845|nr:MULTISPECIES: hypothetical protein [unclassified Vibrio]OBT15490.1 hypothetical protein A9260_13310 [Vibrio sp. UCD-FRSSP16_30]OBT20563.1 hypothetical protein A9264_13095 [Vibrio sp. UCD-FRSSP16_10]